MYGRTACLDVVFHSVLVDVGVEMWHDDFREFSKQMSRNGIASTRKRPANAPREVNVVTGTVVNWEIDELERQRLINTYFDGTDQRLLHTEDNSYTNKVNYN